jgi:molecular chaperone IbpA
MNTRKPHVNQSVNDLFDLFTKNMVGMDRWVTELSRKVDSATNVVNYPPYDIIQHDKNNYEIVVALAGFDPTDISVTVENGHVVIATIPTFEHDPDGTYHHRGISHRAFTRKFELDTNVEVIGAEFRNGLLTVTLQRQVPEEKDSKVIKIEIK